MKFIADAMLGRLAKWLRILGQDTVYSPDLEDQDLVRLARAEDRLLLTRDTELARRRGLRSLLVESDRFEDQLAQVLRELNLDLDGPARCARCNALLQAMDRSAAKGRVPPYVYRRHREFTMCPECDRVYWRGTHWQRMRERIDRIREGSVSSAC